MRDVKVFRHDFCSVSYFKVFNVIERVFNGFMFSSLIICNLFLSMSFANDYVFKIYKNVHNKTMFPTLNKITRWYFGSVHIYGCIGYCRIVPYFVIVNE